MLNSELKNIKTTNSAFYKNSNNIINNIIKCVFNGKVLKIINLPWIKLRRNLKHKICVYQIKKCLNINCIIKYLKQAQTKY